MGNSDAKDIPRPQSEVKQTGDVIYFLELGGSKYYCGKTNDMDRRAKEHKQGGYMCPAWVKEHGFVCVKETFACVSDADEDYRTKQYMLKYGIENVRGGSYSNVTLTAAQLNLLNTEFNTANDRCFHCNQPGHFTSKCPNKKNKGGAVREEKNGGDAVKGKNSAPSAILCTKCGRNNHTEEKCYAKTHLNGGVPTSSQPTSSQPTSSQPTSSQPTSSQPTSSQPTSSQPTSSQPPPPKGMVKCPRCSKPKPRGGIGCTTCNECRVVEANVTCDKCSKQGHSRPYCTAKKDMKLRCGVCGTVGYEKDKCKKCHPKSKKVK
jgi:predicted GIY-YIG superfamily endonuclease